MRNSRSKFFAICAMAVTLSVSSALRAEPIGVDAVQIPLNDSAPDQTEAGALTYLGGLHLVSSDGRFGGFSGLGVSQDGRRMISISDRGTSLSINISFDQNGKLIDADGFDLGTLSDLDGSALRGKRWTDAEAMSPGVEGEIIIAFERDHRLWRYDPGTTTPRVLRPPEELSAMPDNEGIEALTLLNDGRLLAISEGSPRENFTVGWVSRAGGWDVLTYRTGDGFRATGAATLPNGDVLVLERYYTPRQGVRIRIKRVDHTTIRPGEEIVGRLVAELAPPLNVDNFEGIDVISGPDGKPVIFLISDDNFNNDQRTLLMAFRLNEN